MTLTWELLWVKDADDLSVVVESRDIVDHIWKISRDYEYAIMCSMASYKAGGGVWSKWNAGED